MKKILITLTIISFMNLIGCYSYNSISKEELDQAEEYRNLQVITKNKYIYEFDEGNYTICKDSIYGTGNLKLVMGKKVYKDYEGSIKFEDVAKLRMEKLDVVITILVVAIPVVIIVIAAANFSPLGGDSLDL